MVETTWVEMTWFEMTWGEMTWSEVTRVVKTWGETRGLK